MPSTNVTRHVNAPRAAVYRALLAPKAVATWMVPTGMTSRIDAFDAREGGAFRISLTYDAPGIGWRLSLDKLAALVEAGWNG